MHRKNPFKKWLGFILMAAATLASLTSSPVMAMGGGGGGGCGGGCGGGGVVDPPPGAPFKDPVELTNTSATPGVFEGTIEAKLAPVNINGVTATMYTYNGLYPGPMIKVNHGDTLKLHFKNSLPLTSETNILGFVKNHTNLHTHGLHVSPMEPADAAHLDIGPGETYDYEYDLSNQPGGALNFLHCHVHGLVAEQYWGGLLSTILVADETPALAGYEAHTLVLKDVSLSGNQPEPYTSTMDYMRGKEGNIIMVNGQVNPVLPIKPGQVQRWHILNGSNARFYKLSLQNHNFYLVGTDGGLLDKPYPVSSILLAPGERIDVLVKASLTKGNFKLLSLPYARMGNMSSSQITLLTMADQGTRTNGVLPVSVNPLAKRLNIDTSALTRRTLVLSMGMGRGYINGQDFDVSPYTVMSDLGQYEVWEIINNSNMDHPFHQHVNAAQVLSITGGDSNYASLYTTIPAWKDVVNIPKGGKATILVPVMDYPGMAMFHCHIVEHEDIGMMGMWHIMDPAMPMD